MLGCWSILGLPVVMMGGEKANPKLMAESPLFRRMGSYSAGQGKWPHPTSSRKPCLGIRRASASPFPEVQTRAVPCMGTSKGPHRFRPPPPRPAPSMGWALGTGWWEGADGQARPDFTSTDPIPTSAGLDLGSRQGSRRPLFPPPPPPTWAPWRRVCHWGAFSGAADGSRRFVGPRSPPLSAACRAPTRLLPSRSPD